MILKDNEVDADNITMISTAIVSGDDSSGSREVCEHLAIIALELEAEPMRRLPKMTGLYTHRLRAFASRV